MRLVWVPQWTVLPVIVEDRAMGDENADASRPPLSGSPEGLNRASAFGNYEDSSAGLNRVKDSMYDLRVQGATPQEQISNSQHFQRPDSMQYAGGRDTVQSNFNMSNMTAALPGYPRGPSQMSYQDAQRFSAALGGVSQMGAQHMQGQSHFNLGNYPMHPAQYSPSYQDAASMYGQMQSGQRPYSAGPSPVQSSFPNPPYMHNPQSQYQYYTGQMGNMGHVNAATMYNQGTGPHSADRSYHSGVPTGPNQPGQYLRPGGPEGPSRNSSNSSSGSIPSTPRGPPRKPKQSGHALWVGNLPTGAAVRDLKDHFSKEATKDIESVFLISKSNCAFVNYRSEAACVAAMNRFHDSRFQGVRLVCRLRRGPASSSPTGPPIVPGAPAAPSALLQDSRITESSSAFAEQARPKPPSMTGEAGASARRDHQMEHVPDRYFIMKSLTLEDMQLSVRNKIWATQAHNEEALNNAYASADKVYLIFSANKSGEYFGYAEMTSNISEEASADLDWAPRAEAVIDDPDVPKSIPTSATEHAPKGRIIDDSARGTIFWEADADEEEEVLVDYPVDQGTKADAPEEYDDTALKGDSHAFGKPFKIEWVSTNRLPFFRTRGLRNPWNANREVKIARDGTELETGVGRRLTSMFHQPAPPQIDPRLQMGYQLSR